MDAVKEVPGADGPLVKVIVLDPPFLAHLPYGAVDNGLAHQGHVPAVVIFYVFFCATDVAIQFVCTPTVQDHAQLQFLHIGESFLGH